MGVLKRQVVLFTFAFSLSAQTLTEVKGHALGETLTAFQAREAKAKPRKYYHDGSAASSARAAFDFPSGSKALGDNVAVFEDGKLVFLQVAVNNNPAYPDFMSFGDAETQLTQTCGPRTNMTDVMTENKLGVTFHQRIVWWAKPDLFAQIVEARNSSIVTLMTPAEHQREIAAQAKANL